MSGFLVTMALLLAWSAAVKLFWLATSMPPRKRWEEAIDVLIDAILLVWIAVLLAGGRP